jgi:hypothetical protein
VSDFWIRKVEAVQAVQNEAGTVPMIGGKPTFLRVFVGSTAPMRLRASAMAGTGSTAELVLPTGLAGTGVLTSTGSGGDRTAWEKSLNFRIPAALTVPGALPVTVTVMPAEGEEKAHVLTHTILFGPRIDLTVYGLVWAATDSSDSPIDYVSAAAPWSDFEPHRRFTENVFPVSSLAIAPIPGVGTKPPSPQPFRNLTEVRAWAQKKLGELPPRSVINILNNWNTDQLLRQSASLFGLTTGRVTEEENGQEPWRAGAVMAQELAHAYGLLWHTWSPGSPYPYGPHGPLAADDYGVNLTGSPPPLIGGDHMVDIMSYEIGDLSTGGPSHWISSFTYLLLLESITAAGPWRSLGGSVAGPLRWCSWQSGRADLFARFSDGSIRHQFFTPSGPGLKTWENLGGNVDGDFAVASWGPDRVDILGRSPDGHLGHKWWDGTGWRPDPSHPNDWEPMGDGFSGAVAATSWGHGRLDVYARSSDGSLLHQYGTINGWSGTWESLGGFVDGPVAAVSTAPNRADIFARGGNGNVFHKWWDGTGWKPAGSWQNLGGPIDHALTAVASGDRVDLYAGFADGTTRHRYVTATGASASWESLGSVGSGEIAAVTDGPGRSTVVRAGGATIKAHRWNGRSWTPDNVNWFDLNGATKGSLAACSWGPGRVDLAAVGLDGAVWHKFFDHGMWQTMT